MKLLAKRFGELINCESGGVLILVSFAMVVILGMAVIAIDVGSLYQTRRQAVSAADAAALAGAQEKIIGGDVGEAVNSYAITHNGADSAEIVDQTSNTIKVRVEKEAPLWFFPAFTGLLGNSSANTSQVSAEAEALIYNPSGLKDLVPFTIPYSYLLDEFDNYNFGEEITLKVGDWKEGPIGSGNFGAVRFPGDQGADTYEERIKEGYPGVIYIGQVLDTEPGNMPNRTKWGVNYRVENDPIVYIPIYSEPAIDNNGKGKIKVVAFAAFELLKYVEGHAQEKDEVIGRFVEVITVGEHGNESTPDFGIKSITLIE